MKVTIGGDRLGAGGKMTANLRTYSRSTHDLSYIFRTTMSSGTLVPFMSEVGLPGDTFDIDLNCNVLTHPTKGPLFGSYKVQLDVFQVPVRLYHSALHNNMLNIGRKMNTVKLPQMVVWAPNNPEFEDDIDNFQINPSHLLSYLNIRGLGYEDGANATSREFNAIPYLAYWDIYKNYYANKSEEIGAYIHSNVQQIDIPVTLAETYNTYPDLLQLPINTAGQAVDFEIYLNSSLAVTVTGPLSLAIPVNYYWNINGRYEPIMMTFTNYVISGQTIRFTEPLLNREDNNQLTITYVKYEAAVVPIVDTKPNVKTFPLANIDTMKQAILTSAPTAQYKITNGDVAPYGPPLSFSNDNFATVKNQEGLALKTYQSDLFNNWLKTEWIDGVDGISEITAIDTSSGSFTIDELNLSKKVYDMLNRIALSGGSYNDWLETVYTNERHRQIESPMYIGGLIKELAFQEVVSQSATKDEPLGSLAGRGRLTDKHKGGKIIAKCDEPCYIMGIVSLTPRVDYSQGNKWDVNLKTMDDFHKPALDEIGYQDLITDQMAAWHNEISSGAVLHYSAGKQPAWINYMTNVNITRGNFAIKDNQMYMTLNRRYEAASNGSSGFSIKDLTTYIDPSKFNHIFADTSLDAQNFWTQISVGITARRKMSAKLIPNL